MRADNAIQLLGIEEYREFYTKDLSGGTQRKLSVAMSLANSPAVCLLDEPSTGLDPGSRRVLWGVLKKELANRVGLITTHAMEEAEYLSDRIGERTIWVDLT